MKRKTQLDESGQVLVLAALCMTILMGFVAVAVDVGLLLREKRLLQIAADSAAIAGAAELNNGDVTAGAQADASLNGVTDGVNGATVAVSQPSAGYVQVIASQSQPTFFMRLFNRSSMTVSALAVAAAVPSPSCVVTLNSTPPGGNAGVEITGSAKLTLTSCGLVDDATPTGLHVTGGAKMSASSIGLVGTANLHNGAVVTPTPTNNNISAVTDPLSSIVSAPPMADYQSGCLGDPGYTTNHTIGPASPSGFVCYSAFSITSGSPTITLNPGLYIFNGGQFNIASGSIINGTGVTFYFVNGASFTFSRGATLNVSAPTSGPYSGILFDQNPLDNAPDSFVGGSAGNINGIFYLPAAQLTLSNGNASTFSTDLVVGSLVMSGDATLTPYSPIAGASPLSAPRLIQ